MNDKVSLVNFGVVKATAPGDRTFYALVQKHRESTVYGREFWQGVAIAPEDVRMRRFHREELAIQEAQVFLSCGVRVDAVIRVDLGGQHVVWAGEGVELAPIHEDAGSW